MIHVFNNTIQTRIYINNRFWMVPSHSIITQKMSKYIKYKAYPLLVGFFSMQNLITLYSVNAPIILRQGLTNITWHLWQPRKNTWTNKSTLYNMILGKLNFFLNIHMRKDFCQAVLGTTFCWIIDIFLNFGAKDECSYFVGSSSLFF